MPSLILLAVLLLCGCATTPAPPVKPATQPQVTTKPQDKYQVCTVGGGGIACNESFPTLAEAEEQVRYRNLTLRNGKHWVNECLSECHWFATGWPDGVEVRIK